MNYFIENINLSLLTNLSGDTLVNKLIALIAIERDVKTSNGYMNKIKLRNSVWEIKFGDTLYIRKNTIATQLIVFLLGNNKIKNPSMISKIIRGYSTDIITDYNALTKPYYSFIRELINYEKGKDIVNNKFSDFLKRNFKSSKKNNFEFISINTIESEWSIDNFESLFKFL